MTASDVTVIIPARNRAHVLRAAVESVLAQTAPPAEIIVIDDASTDDTAAVAEGLPVRLVRHTEARGSGMARNAGVEGATTGLVAFLDSDDEWLPGHLAYTVPQVDGHAFVTSPVIDTFGRLRGNTAGRRSVVRHDSLFFPENVVCTSTVVARRESLVAAGGFSDLPRAQDLDTWIRLLGHGSAVALPCPTARYAVSEEYQEPDLRRRSLAGAEVVRSQYDDAPWMTKRLRDRIRTVRAWDDLRHAQRHRDLRQVVRSARTLAAHGSTPSALMELLSHRRRARRRSATMDAP